jgi:FMN phosphatase YigB (HAD superfamily)
MSIRTRLQKYLGSYTHNYMYQRIRNYIHNTVAALTLIMIGYACFTAHYSQSSDYSQTSHHSTSFHAPHAKTAHTHSFQDSMLPFHTYAASVLSHAPTSHGTISHAPALNAPITQLALANSPTDKLVSEAQEPSILKTGRTRSCSQNSNSQNNNSQNNTQKIIILDLNNFISENTSTITNKIGLSTLGSYILTHWRSPINCCLDTLEKMGADKQHASETELLYKDRRMPHCVVSWQQGCCSYDDVKKALFDYIEELDKARFFKSAQEKQLAQTIISMVLNPEELQAITKPVPAMIQLAQDLKAKNYKLYAIANLAQEAHTQVKKIYPEIIDLFDGIIVSSHAQLLKNDKRLLEKLLATYHLDPAHCTLIDQDKNTVARAHELGIKTVAFTKQQNLRALLKKQGIL